jgi:hypothetical protein
VDVVPQAKGEKLKRLDALDEIRAVHREGRDSLRELKWAQLRRERWAESWDRVCVKYGISARKASRLARGVNGARWQP